MPDFDGWIDADIELLPSQDDLFAEAEEPQRPHRFEDRPRWSRRTTLVMLTAVTLLVAGAVAVFAPWTGVVGELRASMGAPVGEADDPVTPGAPANAIAIPLPDPAPYVLRPDALPGGYRASIGNAAASTSQGTATELHAEAGATRTTGRWVAITVIPLTAGLWLDDRVTIGTRTFARHVTPDGVVQLLFDDRRNQIVLTAHGWSLDELGALATGVVVHDGKPVVDAGLVPASQPVVASADGGLGVTIGLPLAGDVTWVRFTNALQQQVAITTEPRDATRDVLADFLLEPPDPGATSARIGDRQVSYGRHELTGELVARWTEGDRTIEAIAPVGTDEMPAVVAQVHQATAAEWALLASLANDTVPWPPDADSAAEGLGRAGDGLQWQGTVTDDGRRLVVTVSPVSDPTAHLGDAATLAVIDPQPGALTIRSTRAVTVFACVLPASAAPREMTVTTPRGQQSARFVPAPGGATSVAFVVVAATGPLTVHVDVVGGTPIERTVGA